MYKNIVVAGGGVLGSQIAFQAAFKGFNVTFYLRSEDSIKRTMPKVERLYGIYLNELESLKSEIGNKKAVFPRGLIDSMDGLTSDKIDELKANVVKAKNSIVYETSLEKAVSNADLVIETLSEIPDAKFKFYEELQKYIPEKTVIVTNTSSLKPSMFSKATGRGDKFTTLHFANTIWKNNIAEVMMLPETNAKYFEEVCEFAKAMGMVPIKVMKEQAGYLLNSLLIPFLKAAEGLMANGVSDPENIDRAWMIGTGAPIGPFRILDIVGLETAYNISLMQEGATDNVESTNYKIAQMLKKYVDEGKTGINAGEGFYKYN